MDILIIGALFLVISLTIFLLTFWNDIFFTKRIIKKVYGEITYDNPSKIIVYDFSKLDTDGIAGMIYHSDISSQHMRDEIAEGVLKGMTQDHSKISKQDAMEAIGQINIKIPHFFIMKNAKLLTNRFTGKQVIEGEIDYWTQ